MAVEESALLYIEEGSQREWDNKKDVNSNDLQFDKILVYMAL